MAQARRLWDLDLLTLGQAADQVRRRLHPESRVTFVIDRNINYTNVCVSGCRFCAFYRPPGAPEGYVLDWESLAEKLGELKAFGGSGVLLQGGLNPDLALDYYEKLVGFIRGFGLGVHGFSPPEIFFLSRQTGLSLQGNYPPPDGGGPELHPRGRRRNPGGPGAPAGLSQQVHQRPVA